MWLLKDLLAKEIKWMTKCKTFIKVFSKHVLYIYTKNDLAMENDWYVKNFISGNNFVIRISLSCLHIGFVQKI